MSRRFCVMAALMVLLSGWMVPVHAADEEETVKMGEVVVTAGRQDQESAKVPLHVTVIKAEEIETSNAQNVPEVLQSLAGVHITDISGNRRNYNVDLRGFGESSQQNILLLVDGRRVNLTDLSGPDWTLIPLERIERIEVIRGGRGVVMYGDNATAGVINIITKEGSGFGVDGEAAYGSYETYKGAASVFGALDRFSYDFSTVYFDSDGYRDNSDSTIFDLGLNLRVDPTDAFRFQVGSGYHHDDTRNPGAILQSDLDAGMDRTETTHPDDFDKVGDYYVKLGMELDMLSNDMFKVETSFRNRDKESYGSYSAGWFEADTKTDIVTVSPQLIFREDFNGIANSIILGLDYLIADQNYDSQSEYLGFGDEISGDMTKENTAFFIHDELSVGDKVTISGGYRYDRVKFTYDFDTKEHKSLDEDAYDIGVNYQFGRGSRVYTNFSQGFRYPVMDEQFSYATSSVDDTLQAQLMKDLEVGGVFELFAGLSLQANLFLIAIDDEIFFNLDHYANENMEGETIRQGIETGLSWRRSALSMGATYKYTDTRFEDGPYKNKEVPNVPRHKGTAYVTYRTSFGLLLGLDAVYVGERYLISDFQNRADKAEDYTVVNAKLEYNWRQLGFYCNLNNLFNEEYSAYSGLDYTNQPGYYPSPKFNFLAGVKLRLGDST